MEGLKTTNIPERRPPCQIRMINLALRVDVLARSHHHALGGSHIDQRCLPRISVGHVYGDGETICRAPEDGRQSAGKVKEEGRGAIVEG